MLSIELRRFFSRYLSLVIWTFIIGCVPASPLRGNDAVISNIPQTQSQPLMANRFIRVPVFVQPQPFYYQPNHPSQTYPFQRGPFDFIGNWIQQTPWLPLEVNVPEVFQNIGNGINTATGTVQNFTSNIGSGVTQWTQNIGNGFNQFTQNVGSGFNQFTQNVGNGWNQLWSQFGQRVPVVASFVPVGNNNGQQVQVLLPIEYPGGQELTLEDTLP